MDRGYPTVYGLYTNKVGVGKTTLAFHMACSYAKLFPNKAVVAIDMCPQSNLSATLLTNTTDSERVRGDARVSQLQRQEFVAQMFPPTIGGFFMNYVTINQHVDEVDWLVRVRQYNKHLPYNLHLLCGDRSLDLMVEPLTKKAATSQEVTRNFNPYRLTHMCLRSYISDLAKHFKEKEDKELVVFIDTNPALTIYTQIALAAMTHLIIPVNADSFSEQAVQNMFHLVYGLFPAEGPAADFERNTFAHKAKPSVYNIPLPQIAAIVHNRLTVTREGQARQAARVANAYQAIGRYQVDLLFEGYKKARDFDTTGEELNRVFLPKPDLPFADNQQRQFAAAYTAVMRDMRTSGVAALYCGLPAYLLPAAVQSRAGFISTYFPNARISPKSTKSLMKDMWQMLNAVLGAEVMAQADPAAAQEMEQLAGEDEVDDDRDSQ